MNKLSRANQILAGVLVLQVILLAVVLWPRSASTAAGGESLFENLQADKVVRLTITELDGKQIQLAKTSDGWALPEADDYPVQGDKVTKVLDKLVDLKTDRLVAESSTSYKRLKVADDEYQRLVEFDLEDGSRQTFYLGTSPNYSVAHVRLAGQDAVYLVSGFTVSDASTTVSSWVDTLYMSVPRDEIVAVTIENKNGKLEFTKDDAGVWALSDVPPDEEVDEGALKSVPVRADDIRMLRPLGKTAKPEYGFDEPNAVVTIQQKDSEGNLSTYTLTVGAKDESDNTYVLISSESPYYVRVSEYTAKDFVEWTQEDFYVKPPTPTPQPAG